MKSEPLKVYAATAQPPPDAKQFWQFQNAASSEEPTLYVYGDIVTYDLEEWNWPDDVVPNKFKNELNELGDVKNIHVRINSNGGSVFAAYAIMNLLKAHRAKIIVHIDGIAASAATIIAMAGDKIITAQGSVWMIHLPSVSPDGPINLNELPKIESALKSIGASMVDIYHAKTGIEKAEIEQIMVDETWLTGTDAFAKGFADEITEMEAVAYLSTDKKTACFGNLSVDITNVRNKDKLLTMLKEAPPHAAPAAVARSTFTENKSGAIFAALDLAELKAKFPNIYEAAVKDGEAKGVQAERARIKEIDAMALPGMDALTNKAKFETGITAGELAVEMIKAQKQKGADFLASAQADAAQLNGVPAAATPQGGDAQEEQALLAKIGAKIKK